MELFEDEGPDVLALSGLPGIGKSSLLRAFSKEARAQDRRVEIFDCRTLEPTVPRFEKVLLTLWQDRPGEGWRVLCLDHYDHFRLLDSWLRDYMEELLDKGLRLVLVGPTPQGLLWSSPDLRMRSLRLDGLDTISTDQLLSEGGVEGARADRIRHLAKGHPLALELALTWTTEPSSENLDTLPPPQLVHRLTRYFLDQVRDPDLREALEACATVRRVTHPILGAMLESEEPRALFDRLSDLPLVDVRSDGLSLHPTVHPSVSSWLRSHDPARFTEYRRRAWAALEQRSQNMAAGDHWRYTADVLYLIEDPVLHEAFFPQATHHYSVHSARPEDHEAILEISQLHDTPEDTDLLRSWLIADPRAFHVVRDSHSAIQGFYCLLSSSTPERDLLEQDPITAAWHADFHAAAPSPRQQALYIRRWLSRSWGDAPSPIQGACWVDIKRAYLEGRPWLRRAYLAVSQLEPFAEAATKLGFVPICTEADHPLGSAMLDFGPGSVDSWLGRLVNQSLGLQMPAHLDTEGHALSLGPRSLSLTPRECDLLRLLLGAEGAAVSRQCIMQEVWDGGYSVGSNVLDVLVRGLRKKLGQDGSHIETVRGVGYRWVA